MLDEPLYNKLIAATFARLEKSLGDVDPDVLELTVTGDMMTMLLPTGTKVILNTQRAVRQLWLAARANAWHFSYDDRAAAWHDDKGRGELFAILRTALKDLSGQDLLP